MEWASNRYRGWKIYWHRRDHRMYAQYPLLIGSRTHHFHDRPGDVATAFAIARDWIDRHG